MNVHVSTVGLLLVSFISGSAVATHYWHFGSPGGHDKDKFTDALARGRVFVGFDTRRSNDHRQKRAGASLFTKAMSQLLKSTFGFRWVKLSDGSKVQSFIKVGTVEDAFADFNSFGPTGVTQVGNKLSGRAGRQAVGVVTASPESPLPQLYIGDKLSKLVYYVETPEKAQLALRRLQTLSDLQKQKNVHCTDIFACFRANAHLP